MCVCFSFFLLFHFSADLSKGAAAVSITLRKKIKQFRLDTFLVLATTQCRIRRDIFSIKFDFDFLIYIQN